MNELTRVSNECFKCRSRFCSNGIISSDDDGEAFNEIACPKHTDDLYKYADEVLGSGNGVMRMHLSTSSILSRRILKEDLIKDKERKNENQK